jgi:HTH-type transcriptional regulator, sugar sensing transcriptional regulator
MDVVDSLQQLGFTEYEARAYVALLQRYPVNGATVAKLAHLPRANVYDVLSKLEARGAVVRVETEAGASYAPIPPDELFQHLSSQFEGALQSARRLLLPLTNRVEDQYVQNIEGQATLFQHAHDLINEASTALLIAVWQAESQAFAAATAQAQARAVAFTTLCFQACAEACPYCRQPLYRFHMSAEDDSRWFIIVRDNAELVIGVVSPQQTVGIRTKQKRLVEMASWYMRHSAGVALLLSDLGSQVEQIVNPTTRALLQSVGPAEGWIQSVLSLLHDGRRSEAP